MARSIKTAIIVSVLVAFAPSAALATTMEYYCYGGFEPIVSAFKLISAIFGNNSYQALFFTVIVTASTFAGLGALAKITSGGNGSILGWTVPMLLGITFYIALFIPKGSLHVYDQVLNKYEEVANIPNGIVLVAGVFNNIERGLVEIVSDSSAVGSFQSQAGGKGFLGLYSITTKTLSPKDSTYLVQNLDAYIQDCVTFAVNNPSSTLSVDELRRTPASLATSLAKAKSSSIFTKYFSEADKLGASATCTEAWDAISADMTPETLSGNIESTCTELGYNITDATQLSQCRKAINDAQSWVGLGALTLDEFIKQQFVTERLVSAYQSGNTQQVSNYQFLTNVSGSMKSFNEFYPMLRGVLTAVSLALIPILVIFLPTPMAGKIASIIFGFFVWLTAWGVVDAILHGFAMSYADSVYEKVRNEGLGLDALYFFPDSTVKALGMFGTLRLSGLMLATALTGMLVKFGGHAITQMGSSLQGHVAAAGGIGASRTEDVVGQGQAITTLTQTSPVTSWAAAVPQAVREMGAYGNLVAGTGSGIKAVGGVAEAGSIPSYMGTQSGMGRMETSGNIGAVGNWGVGVAIGHSMGMSEASMRSIQGMFKMNPGAFATTMQRLQTQADQNGWSGEEAAHHFMAGKVLEDMKGSVIGNIGGFNFSQVVTGGDQTTVADKGLMKLTWGSNGLLQDASGFHMNFDYSAGIEEAYSARISDSRAETASHLQNVGWGFIESWSNSDTRSSLNSIAQRSSVVRTGMNETSKAVETAVSQLAEKAQTITDSHGNVIDKGSEAWAAVTASAKAGVEFLGSGGNVGTELGGRKTVQVRTSDGHTYNMSFGEKESRQIGQRAGKVWRDSTARSKSTDMSATDQRGISEAQSLTRTTNALEQVSASEQRTKALEEARTSSMRMAETSRTVLDTAFVRWLGEKNGGGVEGDINAANQIQDLASSGTKESVAHLNQLRNQFIAERGLQLDGGGLPSVEGPTAKMPNRENVIGVAADTAERLEGAQNSMPKPVDAPANLRRQIQSSNPLQGIGEPNTKGYQRYLNVVKDNMGTVGGEMEKINSSPISPDLVFWGQVASPNAKDASTGYIYDNVMPSEFFDGTGRNSANIIKGTANEVGAGVDRANKIVEDAVRSVVPPAPQGNSDWGAYGIGEAINSVIPEGSRSAFMKGLGAGAPPFQSEAGTVLPSQGFSVAQKRR